MRINRVVVAMVVSVVALASCKKTEEGESKRWERALTRSSSLAATHPGFKAALDEQRVRAQALMDAAQKVGDKKERIAAMSAASNILSGGFVRDLEAADTKIKALREELVSLTGQVETDAEKNMLVEAKRQAEMSLRDVDRALERGAATATAAAAVLTKAGSDLDFADKALAQVRKQIQGRKGAERDTATAEREKAEADKAAVADWTCEFCDHKNKHDHTKCANCGAQRSTPATDKPATK